jgi:16S rRNA (cytidine1402-2'-O)-methyltransferase
MSGKLFLTATPIGNLEDITLRALRILKEADIIAAEDTRRTRKLLTHFDIHTQLTSYYEQNKNLKTEYLISLLQDGKNIALVSDAGTPGISDPGSELVKKAIEIGIAVVPVPGAVAFITALVASGLPTERFVFYGFLPRKDKDLRADIEKLRLEGKTTIFYEAPHRVLKTLQSFAEILPERQLTVARELTKIYEEFVRGTTREVYGHFSENPPRGEFCLVLGGNTQEITIIDVEDIMDQAEVYYHEQIAQGIGKKEALKKTAQKYGLSKNTLYQKWVVQNQN